MSFEDVDTMPLDYMIWLYDRQQQYLIDKQNEQEGKRSIEHML